MSAEELFPILNIPELPCPDNVAEALKTVNEVMVSSLESHPIDLDSGYLPFDIDQLGFPCNIHFLMFVWVTESNTVFQNLNLVLNDMNTLAKQSYAFKGSPTARLKLLLRTFFYELFRLREIFTVFLKDLKNQNILSKAEIHELKREIGQHFDRTTKIRNRMVHEYFHWPSRNIAEMDIVEGLKHFDKVWAKKDLSEIYTLEGKIRDVYNEMVPVLTVEGHYIYEYLKNFGNSFAASLKDISSRYEQPGR